MDFGAGHALVTEEGLGWHVYTTVQDFAKVVARALDYEGRWPEDGGVVGDRIQQKDIVDLAEKYRGMSIAVPKE